VPLRYLKQGLCRIVVSGLMFFFLLVPQGLSFQTISFFFFFFKLCRRSVVEVPLLLLSAKNADSGLSWVDLIKQFGFSLTHSTPVWHPFGVDVGVIVIFQYM